MKRSLILLALFGGGLLTSVKGSTIVTVASPTTDGVNFDWVYTLAVTTGSVSSNGISSLEIFDVAGYVRADVPNGFWSVSTSSAGGGLTDVTFSRSGDGIFNSYNFTIVSSDNTAATGSFTVTQTGPDPSGSVNVPGSPSSVPEPTSALLVGGGLFGLAALRRRRN